MIFLHKKVWVIYWHLGKHFCGGLKSCEIGGSDGRFDVEGTRTGFGSLDWQMAHEPARETAGVIKLLLEQGAVATGKQIMDEFGLR